MCQGRVAGLDEGPVRWSDKAIMRRSERIQFNGVLGERRDVAETGPIAAWMIALIRIGFGEATRFAKSLQRLSLFLDDKLVTGKSSQVVGNEQAVQDSNEAC